MSAARRIAVVSALVIVAGALAVSVHAVSSWKSVPRPVPSAWFCRVWHSYETMTGPVCALYPAAYKPPWPYLDLTCRTAGRCRVVYPSPSARPARGG